MKMKVITSLNTRIKMEINKMVQALKRMTKVLKVRINSNKI